MTDRLGSHRGGASWPSVGNRRHDFVRNEDGNEIPPAALPAFWLPSLFDPVAGVARDYPPPPEMEPLFSSVVRCVGCKIGKNTRPDVLLCCCCCFFCLLRYWCREYGMLCESSRNGRTQNRLGGALSTMEAPGRHVLGRAIGSTEPPELGLQSGFTAQPGSWRW